MYNSAPYFSGHFWLDQSFSVPNMIMVFDERPTLSFGLAYGEEQKGGKIGFAS